MPRSSSARIALFAFFTLVGCGQATTPPDSAVAGDVGGGIAPRVHRAVAMDCTHERAAGDAMAGEPSESCSADADCAAGINGRCLTTRGGAVFNYCSYDACFADTECTGGSVCRCREAPNDANVCTVGNCVVDADCGVGGFCSPSVAHDRINLGVVGYYCHTASDLCLDDEDCRADGGLAKCTWFPDDARFACSNEGFFPP